VTSNAVTFWFTGLSGAGKTTIATAVKPLLQSDGYSVLMIDGDEIRKRSHRHLGFTEIDIKQNNALIAELCHFHQDKHDVILVPIISPYSSSRRMARELLVKDFQEIYFSADLETVRARDVKDLYSKAEHGEISNLIGFSPGCVYQAPQSPDLVINSGVEDVDSSVDRLYQFVVGCLQKRNIDA